jgi:hypothetical protein
VTVAAMRDSCTDYNRQESRGWFLRKNVARDWQATIQEMAWTLKRSVEEARTAIGLGDDLVLNDIYPKVHDWGSVKGEDGTVRLQLRANLRRGRLMKFACLSDYLARRRLGGVWAHGFFKDRRVHQL